MTREQCEAIQWFAREMDRPDFMDGLCEAVIWVGLPFPIVIVESENQTDVANRPRRGIVGAFNERGKTVQT